MTEPQPVHPERAALQARVERCWKRSRRATSRLAAAEMELEDANAAGRAACTELLAWIAANPEPQMEMVL